MGHPADHPAECANPLACSPAAAPKWMVRVLLVAAAYNIAIGIWAVLWPGQWFELSGMAPPLYPDIWRTVGMIVGVYGIGYLIAAANPFRHWPVIFVGLLGKVLGPLGFVSALIGGTLPLRAGWLLLANDLVWWVPFGLILWGAVRAHLGLGAAEGREGLEQAVESHRLSSGETLAEASSGQLVALVFLRHFGCTFTRQILMGLQELEAQAAAHGARLVLVHMLRDGRETGYLASERQIARIADPNCRLYRAFDLGQGGVFELFGPRVWILGVMSLMKGCGVGHLAGDGLQMPGAFLLRDSRIVAAQRARSAADLPNLAALFRAGFAERSAG